MVDSCSSNRSYVFSKIGVYSIQVLIAGIFFPVALFGQIEFSQIFPNTTDDTSLEYIELRNTSCETIDIGGYILEDASEKQYIFPTPSTISSHDMLHIGRPTSKIILNNTDETLFLKDPIGNIVDQFSYTNSTKGTIIIDITLIDEICTSSGSVGDTEGEHSDSGNMVVPIAGSGSIDTIPEILSDIGSIDTYTGDTETEHSNTNIGMIDSGSIDIDTEHIKDDYLTGNISTGSIADRISFPEIFPTLQFPTNASFSGGIFDCSGEDPCRINVTFEPIFTGSFRDRDYICEVIHSSGTLTTCNPNTLYFSTGGFFTFRLTKKSDPNDTTSVTWEVQYNSIKTNLLPLKSGEEGESIATSGDMAGIIFPDIIPIFQNYTNTTFSGDTLTCTMNPCRLNMTLDPIFTGAYISKEYTCEVLYGTGKYDCNPPQLYLNGTGSIEIRLIHKYSQENISRILPVIQDIPIPQIISNNLSKPVGDSNPPIIVLEYDGKIKSYHEPIGDHEMNCYTLTCAINLTAENSYDPEGSSIHYLWYYGFNDIKTTKDPGERKYGLGDHTIWLRVIDASGNVASIKYYIHVLGPKQKEEKINTTKVKAVKSKKISIKKIVGVTKKKIKKITFFDPPKIVLQKSKFIEKNGIFECRTTTKTCSLNLTLSGTEKGIVYLWKYNDTTSIVSKNPKSKSFSPGMHRIQLIAGYSADTPIWTQNIQVKVIKIQKPKKVKKPKIVQTSGSKKKDMLSDVPIISSVGDSKSQENTPTMAVVFLLGIMPIFILRKVFGVSKVKI